MLSQSFTTNYVHGETIDLWILLNDFLSLFLPLVIGLQDLGPKFPSIYMSKPPEVRFYYFFYSRCYLIFLSTAFLLNSILSNIQHNILIYDTLTLFS